MREGRRLQAEPALETIRARTLAQLQRLPEALRQLEPAPTPYPVEVSPALQALTRQADARLGGHP